MKAHCISQKLSPQQIAMLGLDNRFRWEFDITPGMVYLVLGMSFFNKSTIYGNAAFVHITDDSGSWRQIPLLLFEIADPHVSRYWEVRQLEDGETALFPESFYQKYYFDKLTDGVPEVVADFNDVYAMLHDEYESDLET